MAYTSRYIESLKIENDTGEIAAGKNWISLYNSGSKSATVESYNEKDELKGSWTLPAGMVYNFPQTKTSGEWGKIIIKAPETTVEATFEN